MTSSSLAMPETPRTPSAYAPLCAGLFASIQRMPPSTVPVLSNFVRSSFVLTFTGCFVSLRSTVVMKMPETPS